MGLIGKKEKVVDFILTQYGVDQYANGTLKFAYFGLGDEEIVYDSLASTGSSGFIPSEDVHPILSNIPILESFCSLETVMNAPISSSYDFNYDTATKLVEMPNSPTLLDYDIGDTSVPSLKVNSILGDGNMDILASEYLYSLLLKDDTEENLPEFVAVLSMMQSGSIQQQDLYKFSDIKITSDVTSTQSNLNNVYGGQLKIYEKEIVGENIRYTPMMLKRVGKNTYSVGEISLNAKGKEEFSEYLQLELPPDVILRDEKFESILPIQEIGMCGNKTIKNYQDSLQLKIDKVIKNRINNTIKNKYFRITSMENATSTIKGMTLSGLAMDNGE